ncbi:4'-phosphopantetheinyl transferase [Dokdonia pacifica]|uniref:4'-phosphopantetheinyl transferase superfamily protein n=1 Tax=Dokdonia pacifica TaxID=1627892 RepID=A0A238W5V7_9FLAO|nr:4'-phosphopantetheinyl transferase family protein [Dokdonia pacifica]GGG14979.1 4'-phosphopantetheinyl transferase [Dokdonia pacifica]SNR41553.1 4'-phosphopantetheinyl transferase superfamily protein [Dokdonia pacifica]
MPLYKTITINPQTTAYIWKIEEDIDTLSRNIKLTDHCQQRVDGMKSELHQRGFMSVRHLLAEAGYTDFDLYYDTQGKPHLKDGKHISITHSFIFSGIIVSDQEVGIDIEMQRDKIMRIAHKFTPLEEYRTLANTEAIVRKLTIVWGAKESLYKLYAQEGLSFLKHIDVQDFYFDDAQTTASVTYNAEKSSYHIFFLEFEGFTCVYAF